jgi:hypothetical protein
MWKRMSWRRECTQIRTVAEGGNDEDAAISAARSARNFALRPGTVSKVGWANLSP